MGIKGRPSTPAIIKELSGTVRKDRQREGVEFELITEIPKPEVWLDNKAKRYFKNMCSLLISKQLLNAANVQLVLIMAQEFATYEEASRELKKKPGKVLTVGKGYKMPSPWMAIRHQAQKNYKDIAALFGLDPLSQQKIGPPVRGEKDPFEELIKKHNKSKQ